MPTSKRIALVAHDNMKPALLTWIETHQERLCGQQLFATGTTGKLIASALNAPVHCFESGPLGGDQQIGALICEGGLDMMIFFWDPLEAQPHDPDVKALLRLAAVWNVPMACNEATADYLINSPLFSEDYRPKTPDFSVYRARKVSV
jgi:methylglyoxal synthase